MVESTYNDQEECELNRKACETLRIVGVNAAVRYSTKGYQVSITDEKTHKAAITELVMRTIGPIEDLEIILNDKPLTDN